ncbi:MAG: hypothetical protein IJZ21_00040 [Clostridia bacterium]|nr:hypothetical protein [Clostridia bacterium]
MTPYFKKVFTVNTAADAQIKIAACGFYKLFINGEDVIGVILGDGFVNNSIGWVWDFDKAKYRSSPILFDGYRYGEHYDARL